MEDESHNVKLKSPDYEWVENEYLFEQSIRNKNQWIDSFVIYALIWSFGSILKENERRNFDRWLKDEFEAIKTQFNERMKQKYNLVSHSS
jgi:hypothetical protein